VNDSVASKLDTLESRSERQSQMN